MRLGTEMSVITRMERMARYRHLSNIFLLLLFKKEGTKQSGRTHTVPYAL